MQKKQKPANSLNVRHILCQKHSKLLQAYQQLSQGTPFDKVAEKYSQDKARHGGSLGWMARGSMVGPFQELAFSLPVSTTKQPVYNKEPLKTQFGYHIVMVEGRK